VSEYESSFDDGNWHAATLGHFIGLLVDDGEGSVVFRVTHDGEPDDEGEFIRIVEVCLLPNGYVEVAIRELDCDIEKTLLALMKAGLVR